MRRKPPSQNNGGYNNQQRRPRYQGGGEQRSQGGSHHNHSSQGGRSRKNYPAMREKYLGQARDALASGDRVLAENYFQHADHCYRMMAEEGYFTRNQNAPVQQQAADDNGSGNTAQNAPDEGMPENTSQLPAFITASYEQPSAPAEPVPVQNWEERDA